MSKGNTILEVYENFKKFTGEIDINKWAAERKIELLKIITDQDYTKAISVFNNKGLRFIVEKHIKITDFFDRSIKMLQYDIPAKTIL